MTNGFFLVDKPSGMTSHDVVARIRRLLNTHDSQRNTRVGHAGTLDPFATGLLIVGVGLGTKALARVTKFPKTYNADVTFGATSSTDDREGTLSPQPVLHPPSTADLTNTLQTLTGPLQQTPPVYSAIKIRGVPAYRRVRRGEFVTLAPREITVFAAELLGYAYPTAQIRWVVSSGTYIRSLARDLGETLGTGAYLSALRRTTTGPFRIEEATTLDTLAMEHLRPLEGLDRTDKPR